MIKYIKNELKHLPFIAVLFILFYAIVTVATSYVTSKDIYYDNSDSNLNAADMQDAIDEVFQHATDYNEIKSRVTALEDYKNQIYPVGSIYISATDSTAEAVAARFGGTWEAYATGRTLIGMGSNGTNNYTTIGATGGSSTNTLSTANLPVHNHSIPQLNVSSWSGSHNHKTWEAGVSQINPNGDYWVHYTHYGTTTTEKTTITVSGQKTTASNTNGCTGCNGTSFSIIDPYITVYMWKRTA